MTEQQLEDWALLVHDEINKVQKVINETDVECKYHMARGVEQGLCTALSLLNMVERGRFKNRISSLREQGEPRK